ncbi:NUDIX domain-containing protein [Burkholderia pseudomallei]|uniref:NUDIX domain-containing protein n=1 Tax=Burkholderia pseudomallei TaxID=28450 RepID=UPI0035C9ACA9
MREPVASAVPPPRGAAREWLAKGGGDARPSTKRRRDNGRPSTLARPAFAAPPAKHAAAPIKERATIVCRRGARMPLVARTLSRGSPPGGIIHCGEAPLDAARRALEEQTRLAGLELMYFFHVDGHAKRPPCSSPACRPACARARAARSPAAAGRLPTRSRACLCVPVTTPTRATVARPASAEGAPPARDGRRAASHVLVADVAAHLAAEHPV